jgi:hypothetical protein
VRRFLEQHGNSLDAVVFVVDNIDIGIYEVLLPLYFPRSLQEEEAALWQLPANVGGPDGEPLLPDRQIRIIDNPQHSLDGEFQYYQISHICCGKHVWRSRLKHLNCKKSVMLITANLGIFSRNILCSHILGNRVLYESPCKVQKRSARRNSLCA